MQGSQQPQRVKEVHYSTKISVQHSPTLSAQCTDAGMCCGILADGTSMLNYLV